MKLLLLLFCSCEVLLADNPVLILPQRVQFDYPNETRLIVEADKFGKVGSLSLTIGNKKLAIDEANMANIYNPDISTIKFQKTYDDKLKSKIWIVSFEYSRVLYSWGYAANEVEFIFSETGYSHRITKIQISKDTWEYFTKPAKGAEKKCGSGGSLDTEDTGPEKPSTEFKEQSDKALWKEHDETRGKRIAEWMNTEFVVKVPASFAFKELVDYLVSLPPYNVGYEIKSGDFTIPEGRKLELPTGRYLRSDIIAKASSAFDIEILVDDNRKLRFKSGKQGETK